MPKRDGGGKRPRKKVSRSCVYIFFFEDKKLVVMVGNGGSTHIYETDITYSRAKRIPGKSMIWRRFPWNTLSLGIGYRPVGGYNIFQG